jgi:hypothetical protein
MVHGCFRVETSTFSLSGCAKHSGGVLFFSGQFDMDNMRMFSCHIPFRDKHVLVLKRVITGQLQRGIPRIRKPLLSSIPEKFLVLYFPFLSLDPASRCL